MSRRLSADVLNITVPDEYVEHGNTDVLRKEIMLDAESVTKQIITRYIGRQR